MKPITTLVAILFISLLSSPSWSAALGDLVERDGLYYKQFTDVPYTGKVTGGEQGSVKDGEREGSWVGYHENGQLSSKGNWDNGKEEGAWVYYYESGQLQSKGNYKNGEKVGAWVGYYKNGIVFEAWTGTYKDGVKISD